MARAGDVEGVGIAIQTVPDIAGKKRGSNANSGEELRGKCAFHQGC